MPRKRGENCFHAKKTGENTAMVPKNTTVHSLEHGG